MITRASRGLLVFAGTLCVVGTVAAGHDAAGQSCPSPEASVADAAPYVTPTQTTCSPGNYISASDAAPTMAGNPSQWMVPPASDAGPPAVPGDIYAMLGVTNPNATNFVYGTVKAPYPDAAGCHAFTTATIMAHQMVHDCLCDSCFSLMQQCDALQGCQDIIACAWGNGCDPSAALTSTSSCYPLSGTGGCITPINKYGTGSVATALSQQLGLCGQMNKCPAQ